jgi:hypothetical protein
MLMETATFYVMIGGPADLYWTVCGKQILMQVFFFPYILRKKPGKERAWKLKRHILVQGDPDLEVFQ